jgi:hypothetical protein
MGFTKNTQAANTGRHLRRDYYGANLQVQFDHPFGTSTFKTEYVAGTQPGLATSAGITGPGASTSFATQPKGNLYLRHFNGYYFWFTQQIAKTKLTALLAYDVYDPNTDIDEAQIGQPGNYATAGDIKFSTLGYGLTYTLNSRLKLTVYNEKVSNKATLLPAYMADLKDNVFTARLQYRW